MSQEVIDRPPVREASQKKKLSPPKKHRVVMGNRGGRLAFTGCNIGTLAEAFNITTGEAIAHIHISIPSGKSVIKGGIPKDVADTLVETANNLASNMGACPCTNFQQYLHFNSEPE